MKKLSVDLPATLSSNALNRQVFSAVHGETNYKYIKGVTRPSDDRFPLEVEAKALAANP
jgi:hypothetical protein